MLRRTVLSGLAMALGGAWFADRAPGLGKRLIVNTATVGTNGIVAVGQPTSGGGASTIPQTYPPLPEPGTTIPPGGADRTNFFNIYTAFKYGTGFNSNTGLTVPAGTNGTSWSFSCWLNFGISTVLGFAPTPTPLGFMSYIMYPAVNGGDGIVGHPNRFGLSLAPCSRVPNTNNAFSGAQIGGNFTDGGGGFGAAFSYPPDTEFNNRGWVHFMAAYRVHYLGGDPNRNLSEDFIIYVNDTPVIDARAQISGTIFPNYVINFSYGLAGASGAGMLGVGSGGNTGDGLYAGVAELWEAPNQFIDWADQNNRERFHVKDGIAPPFTTYAPCDLGPTGKRPTGTKPRLYCSGPPALFVVNRASGSTLALAGDPLVLIDDNPS